MSAELKEVLLSFSKPAFLLKLAKKARLQTNMINIKSPETSIVTANNNYIRANLTLKAVNAIQNPFDCLQNFVFAHIDGAWNCFKQPWYSHHKEEFDQEAKPENHAFIQPCGNFIIAEIVLVSQNSLSILPSLKQNFTNWAVRLITQNFCTEWTKKQIIKY